jgi:glycosyltransferase involved in cell wall biosynthesis
MRAAIIASHPIQYYGPLFRTLAKQCEITVLFAHRASRQDQARAGFGAEFDWDVDITSGYAHEFLDNVARQPGTDHFSGCDTPQVGDRLRAGRYDAVLVTGWHLKSYIQALIAAKRMGVPVLVRGDSQLATPRSRIKQAGKALAYPPFLRLFNAALYVGERSRAYYLRYGYPEARLFFSPHSVDSTWFAERASQHERRRLRAELRVADDVALALFAGKLVEFKRPADLIRAVASLRERGQAIQVAFAGDGALLESLAGLAAELRTPAHFLGFRNQSEMPAVYAAADVLILPSDSNETWGLVVNEALACKRPVVVSTTCGCAPDLVADKRAGRCFATGDIEAMAQAISAVLFAPPSQEAIEEVTRKYSLDAAARGIREAIDYVSDRARREKDCAFARGSTDRRGLERRGK